ncbi:MAG: acyl-CoA thioesterase [Neisseria sp.]|nr:acyl-CoA thioesterase [Neisseria sp.]
MDNNKPLPTTGAVLRAYPMPADTNTLGKIFGGWIMSQFDVAGALVAVEAAKGPMVTVAVDKMVFYIPVNVGDVASCYGEIVRIGNTSITVRVQMWTKKPTQSDSEQKLAAEALYTYVAIDENGQPRSVASL